MKTINKIKHNQGQVAIIVLLISAVLLTLGMSASKKTITDIKVDTDEELLKEAFNTAESGINNYLNGGGVNYTDSTGAGATVTSTAIGGSSNSLSAKGPAAVNSPQFFWLVNHNGDGSIGSTYYPENATLTLKVTSGYSGAVKIDYFYKNGVTYKASRSGYNFDGAKPIVTGYTPNGSDSINIPLNATAATDDPLLLVVTPLGSATGLTLTSSSATNFPFQGEELTSVGTANNGVKTQVKTRHTYEIPSFLLESITAIGTIQ